MEGICIGSRTAVSSSKAPSAADENNNTDLVRDALDNAALGGSNKTPTNNNRKQRRRTRSKKSRFNGMLPLLKQAKIAEMLQELLQNYTKREVVSVSLWQEGDVLQEHLKKHKDRTFTILVMEHHTS